MRRRHLICSAAAFALAGPATADFSPAVWDDLKGRSDPVILNFRANWSLTCQIKADIIADLRADQPAYADLTIVDVNWDTFGPSELVKRLDVDRHSTLLVLKEGREVARLVAQPYERKLRALFDTALAS